MQENWLPIPNHPGYEASDFGRIRSTDRVIPRRITRKGKTFDASMTVRGKELHPWRNNAPSQWSGVVLVGLENGRQRPVGQLVLEAFVGPRGAGMEMCHRNDDPWDNRLPNLYWGSRSENRRDLVRNGKHNNAKKTHCKRGHLFDETNTYVTSAGHRACRSCCNARNRARRASASEQRRQLALPLNII